ncbi:hypothetical protein PACTADRAFT_48186 [Pachysolen tannophilus NRRL Y-2460]|uniref:Borealin N-terminal domain-containing protein n=1 Tax=Pachysolen tannophilus NRRL Y-2460 TaxID=669874 RepID=A0A1E4U341_PACTA|nr:hypothetical protein PACTADRAFT_48186 [Pachysolen tannophilus NRRL Y-2460]
MGGKSVRRFTKTEKMQLIERFEIHLNNRRNMLINQTKNSPADIENKLRRRLDRVLRKLWDVKMKDVLDLEREQKVNIVSLIKDVEEYKKLSRDGSGNV